MPVGYAHLTVPGAGVGGVRGGSGMGRIRVGSDGVWRVRWGKGGGEWGMGVGCYEGVEKERGEACDPPTLYPWAYGWGPSSLVGCGVPGL